MNCKDIRDLLSAGQPLSAEALEHVEACPGCRAMLAALSRSEAAQVDPFAIERFTAQLRRSLEPVRPMPSDAVLVGFILGLFAICSLLCAVLFGFAGFYALNPVQRITSYSAILVFAGLLSFASIRQLIPGSRRHLNPSALVAATLALLAFITVLLFHTATMPNFVHRGIPCLRLGLICALGYGVLNIFLTKAGYVTTPVDAGLLLGSLAGLVGFAVLALHCPVLVASHVLVWHLGPVFIAAAAGMLIGYIWREKSS